MYETCFLKNLYIDLTHLKYVAHCQWLILVTNQQYHIYMIVLYNASTKCFEYVIFIIFVTQ